MLRWIKGSEYSKLKEYFHCFEVYEGNGGLDVSYGNFEQVVINEKQSRKTIGDHLGKLPVYRKNLPAGHPVWFMLYTEGDAASRRHSGKKDVKLIERIYNEAVRRTDTESENYFNQVWLGTDVMIGDEGRTPRTTFHPLV